MHNFGARRNKRSEINITPLVDVMLVLLVVFMVVAPTMHSDLDIKVPRIKYVKNIHQTDKQDLIKVAIAENKLLLNEKIVDDKTLLADLKKYKKNLVVFVKADKKLTYDRLFEVIDLIKSAGFIDIALVGRVE